MSLRLKLTLTHAAVALLMIVVLAVVINRMITAAFERLAEGQAARTAEQMAPLLSDIYGRNNSWQGIRRVLRMRPALRERLGGQRLLVAEPNGRLVGDSQILQVEGFLTEAQRAGAVPIIADGREVGLVAVVPRSGAQLGELEDDFLTLINRRILLVSLLAALCAGLVGLGIAGRLTRPLRALTGAVRQVATHGRREPLALAVASGDEVGELTQAFNQMSAQLAQQEELRRHLVADIAHELRTPLSVLRMQLESVEDGVVAPTPELISSLQEEVGLLGRLIDDLRLLSLTEAGQLSLQLGAVDAGQLLERVGAQSAAAARQRQVSLETLLPPGLPAVHADGQRLGQVLGNLVQNALRHTPAQGRVTLGAALGPSGRSLQLSVQDSGAGIAPHELERIFERFYRSDPARARETGGSGLGLAIVRGLVQAMGGRVWAESPPGQGARFVVELPVA